MATVVLLASAEFSAGEDWVIPFELLGILYVVTFLSIGSRWPNVALALTFAIAPFSYELSGGLPVVLALGEVNLCLLFILYVANPRLRGRGLTLGPIGWAIVLYLCVCVISSMGNWHGSTAVVSLMQMCVYLILAVVVFTCFGPKFGDPSLSLIGLLVTSTILGGATIFVTSGYVFGLHKNAVGSCLACAVLVASELWLASRDRRLKRLALLAITVCGGGLVVTLSRGAWLSTLVGLAFIATLRREFRMLARGAAVLVPIVVVAWTLLPEGSKEFATGFDAGRVNISARYKSIDFAQQEFQKDPILGVGVGLRKEFDATNIVWTTLAETGVLGLTAFLLIHVAFLKMVWTAQGRIAKSDPAFSYLAVGGALLLAQLAHGLVDHYWSRGSLLLAWGAAGMAIRASLAAAERARGIAGPVRGRTAPRPVPPRVSITVKPFGSPARPGNQGAGS